MSLNAAWFEGVSAQLNDLKTRFSAHEELVGTLVADSSTEVEEMAGLWQGPLPDTINSAAADYATSVNGAAAAIGAGRELLGQLARFAEQLAGDLKVQEDTLSSLAYVQAYIAGADVEEIDAARDSAQQAIADLRTSWITRCAALAGEWESTINGLTTVINSVAVGPSSTIDVPTQSEYLLAVAQFSARSGLSFDVIDPSGQMQQRVDELFEQLKNPEGNLGAALTSMVIDVANQADLDEWDGNWSMDDIIAASENGASVYFILTQINSQQDMGWTDEQISAMTDEITANAWLLRADQSNDWEDLDDDRTFGDWFKENLVGPVAGVAAGAACMALTGPESGFLTTGACIMAGGATARAVDSWANGGSLVDGLEAAVDPRGVAIDLAMVGGVGLFQVGRYVIHARHVEGAPSVWSLGWSERGYAIESMVGGNLPHGFRTIDILDDGYVASVKSLDLAAPTYQNVSQLTSRVTGYVDNMATYSGGSRGGVDILGSDITGRGLMLAVPPGGTAAQQAALDAAVQYGADKGVDVVIVVMP